MSTFHFCWSGLYRSFVFRHIRLQSFAVLPACRRLLFPLLHAEHKRNRRRLHAGNLQSFVVNVCIISIAFFTLRAESPSIFLDSARRVCIFRKSFLFLHFIFTLWLLGLCPADSFDEATADSIGDEATDLVEAVIKLHFEKDEKKKVITWPKC